MQLCYRTKFLGCREDNELYEDLSVAGVDLNFENYEELFGIAQNNSEQIFEGGGLDNFFGIKDISAANSKNQGEFVAEVLFPTHSSIAQSCLFSSGLCT